MLKLLCQTFFGDFLKNFKRENGEDEDIEDPDLIQLQYQVRWIKFIQVSFHVIAYIFLQIFNLVNYFYEYAVVFPLRFILDIALYPFYHRKRRKILYINCCKIFSIILPIVSCTPKKLF
jgi:hypothetical protein